MTGDSDILMRLGPIRDGLAELEQRRAVDRLHARDAGLWSDDARVRQTIGQRLGWLDTAGGGDGWRERIQEFVTGVRDDGLSNIVLAGMGGSSLAPQVFARVFAGRTQGATLSILDSTHPQVVRALLDEADRDATLVVVSSKSGTTEETRAFGARAAALLESPASRAAITDPGSQLAEQAVSQGWRAALLNPADIGGRFSALSLFGMVPAALVGVDIDAVWRHGRQMLEQCRAPAGDNPAAVLGAFMGGLARNGRDKLTLLCHPALESLGDWIEQLVAESTGKNGVGVIPVVGEPAAPPDAYGADRAFVAIRFQGEGPDEAAALAAAGQPVLPIDVDEPEALGAEFVRWEIATALAGALLGVNPFDEPNVTESKRNTSAVLDEIAYSGELPAVDDGDVEGLLGSLRPGDYLAVQAYLPPTAAYAAPIGELRARVRDRAGTATTAGWGPRFLHSTGQLHKGGPGSVVALQLVDPVSEGPPIPGRAYDFATLLRAQATGDLRSLRAAGRRVAQVAVDSPGALAQRVSSWADLLS